MHRKDPAQVVIRTERLVARMARREDAEALASFYRRNRTFLQPFSPRFDEELFSVPGWRERIAATDDEYRRGRSLRLIIHRPEPAGPVLGVANFTSMSGFPTFSCNLGYALAESEQGQGLMTEALAAAIDYVFGELGMHRIEASYMPRNLASERVLQKLGFFEEGFARASILIDGQWEDHVRTALINEAWTPEAPWA